MPLRSDKEGFLEKMLGPLPGDRTARVVRWVGDPVRTHLALLLNTRRGSVKDLPDYGLPDMSSFFSEYPTSLADLRSVVEQLVKKYEPRLLDPRVRLIESDTREFRASFLITGEIEVDQQRSRVQYRTTISSSGRAALGEAGNQGA